MRRMSKKAYLCVCLFSYFHLTEARSRVFLLFAIKFNEMKKYFTEWKHIFALFRAYPLEYQPDNVVQGRFQQVLT